MELRWTNSEDIAIELSELHPETDPLSLRFTDLHKLVTGLPNFKTIPNCRMRPSSRPFRWPGTTNGKKTTADQAAARNELAKSRAKSSKLRGLRPSTFST